MITPYNILRHELVGLKAKAQTRGKKSKIIEGEVEFETERTIRLKTPQGVKTITKESSTLELWLDDGAIVVVEGTLLAQRPEDRIKKKRRIRF